jgi:CHAT domain-containing protein
MVLAMTASSTADRIVAIGAARGRALLSRHPDWATPELARKLCERADALDMRSESQRAEELAGLAREVAVHCGDAAGEARALWVTGKSRDSRDLLAPARQAYEEGYIAALRAQDHHLIAATLAGIGTEYVRAGDTDRRAELRDALELARSIGDDRIAAIALARLGYCDQNDGNYAEALRKYDGTIPLARRGHDLVVEAMVVGNTGNIYEAMNNHVLGMEYLHRGIALFRRAHNITGAIRYIRNLADNETWDGRWEEAEEHLAEVERLLRSDPNDRISAFVATTRCTLASLRHDDTAAARYCATGLALAEKAGVKSLVTNLTEQLARARVEQRRYAEAAVLATQAVERSIDVTPSFEVYWQAKRDLGRALAGEGKLAEARQAFGDAIGAIEGTLAKAPPGREDQQAFFADKVEPYYGMFVTYAHDQPEEAIAWIERARARTLLEMLEQANDTPRLYAAHPDLTVARGDVPPASLHEIQQTIPPDGVVLEYASLEHETWLIVVTRDEARIHAIPVEIAALRRTVAQFGAQLAARGVAFRAPARRLYDLLLGPAAPALAGKRIVCVIPDFSIGNLPFQALIDRNGRYVIERSALFYAPSLAFLAWRAHHPPARTTGDRVPQVLAFGNPRIAVDTVRRVHARTRGESLVPLPEAEEEVRALKRMYGERATLRVGAAATEKDFKNEAPRYRVLHLATHGIYDDSDPMNSHLVLARGRGDRDDGLLEARELADLALDADLVVLSACESGRGTLGGEGMIGFSWAIIAAGCDTAILTHFKIGSVSSRDLMIAFHHRLALRGDRFLGGRTATDALREAELAMLRSGTRAHPFYWAAFSAVGQGW